MNNSNILPKISEFPLKKSHQKFLDLFHKTFGVSLGEICDYSFLHSEAWTRLSDTHIFLNYKGCNFALCYGAKNLKWEQPYGFHLYSERSGSLNIKENKEGAFFPIKHIFFWRKYHHSLDDLLQVLNNEV